MLIQLHAENYKTRKSRFVAQGEYNPKTRMVKTSGGDMHPCDWPRYESDSSPLQEGEQWLVCDQNDKHFIKKLVIPK